MFRCLVQPCERQAQIGITVGIRLGRRRRCGALGKKIGNLATLFGVLRPDHPARPAQPWQLVVQRSDRTGV